ncbi:MAG: Maf family nucleotide pyrophosphatase [Bifidobacteriaceae bacterium]|nr:Maf family nucleotide pyrophosphatase [Bifidobacteriaceae bacterium]
MQVKLILASASPARLATLRAAGINPTVRVADIDEPAVLAAALANQPNLSPVDQVVVLAKAKAQAVAAAMTKTDLAATDPVALSEPTARVRRLVLGCDSMLELDGQVVGKPSDPQQAKQRIRQQSGRNATLHTGHWLCEPDGAQTGAASSTVVQFADLTDSEIDAYVATGEPLAVAGAFTIDGLGGPFIRGVIGDHHGVIGLSLPLLRNLLKHFGIAITDLWQPAAQPQQPPK